MEEMMTMIVILKIVANIYLGWTQAELFSKLFTCINLFIEGGC